MCIRLLAFGISLKSKLPKHITDNRTEKREAQRLAGFTGERSSPYLFISSAPWPKYLAKSLLQERTSKARPNQGLILAPLIKIRLTCTKHLEDDREEKNKNWLRKLLALLHIMGISRQADSPINLLFLWGSSHLQKNEERNRIMRPPMISVCVECCWVAGMYWS